MSPSNPDNFLSRIHLTQAATQVPNTLCRRGPNRIAAACQSIVMALIIVGGVGKGCPKVDHPVFSPNTLTFAAQVVNSGGKPSAPQSVTLTATGTASSLAITSINTSGDYSQTSDCPSSLATGASCTIQVTFAPNQVGLIQGSLSVNGGEADVTLSGTGIAPVSFSPTSLDFGTIDPGTTSGAQSVTLTNNQTTALTVTRVQTSGDYLQTNNCPVSPASLAAGKNCTIQITFTPTSSGATPGALTVVTDALPGSQPLILTGVGSGSVTPLLSFTPSSLSFSDQEAGTASAAQPVTLTNTSGHSSVTINAVTSSGATYLEGDNCVGQVLAPSGTCTINVTFEPLANLVPITYAGAITVSSTDTTSPDVLGLSGTGVAPVSGSPQAVDFGTYFFETPPATRTITITNNHNADEDVTFDVPSQYTVTNNCSTSLAPGAQCTLDVQPPASAASTPRAITIVGSSGGPLTPQVINLSACGTELSSNPPSFNYGGVQVGNSGDAQTLVLTSNDGTINISDMSIGGPNATDFAIASNTCGSSLSDGQSCIVKTVFAPQASGTRSAALSITDDAHCSPQQVTLSGGSAAGPFTITAINTGSATGTVTSDVAGISCGTNGTTCSAQFNAGATVTLTATPDPQVPFAGWAGACSGTAPCVLQMTADKQVFAIFGTSPQLQVSANSQDGGTGTITSNPAGINCGSTCSAAFLPETVVTLTATPAKGSGFTGWNEGCQGTTSCSVTVVGNESVTGTFALIDFSIQATDLTPATITAGQSATSTITVTSNAGFDSPVSFACSVTPATTLPPTCSMSNITPPVNGSAKGTLTVHTTAPTASLFPSSRRARGFYVAFSLLLGLAGIRVNNSSRRKKSILLAISAVLFGTLAILVACGGGGSTQTTTGSAGTASGIYNVMVTGSSGSLQSQAQLTVTVQ
jgi:Divergent InlB B-repeat domain/Abnormal spindle-like microcephaly-assoc'd, ASPM-SPD-2-Hydin